MDSALVFLLSGLLITGVSIPGMVVPAGVKRNPGTVAQFVFGVVLIVMYFLVHLGKLAL